MVDQSPINKLPPGQQLVATGKWPIIGERKPAKSVPPESLIISGAVQTPQGWSLEQLRAMPQTRQIIDIHCVTRWSKFDVPFAGVLLRDLLAIVGVTDQAKFISFIAHSDRQHSTSLSIDEALKHDTLIALSAEDQPLHVDHGGPIRNVVSGKYFYKSVKWLCEIELLREDRLGYWEAESGYHNGADPWKVQRYMAPTIDRRTAAKLIESKDFSNRDLRSIDASSRNLNGLNAQNSLLRDSNFENSSLRSADFSGANLSNAHFRAADLTDAKLVGSDLEGCDLAAANLSGADLSGCSLIGASFCDSDSDGSASKGAIFNQRTIVDASQLTVLTPNQLEFVKSRLGI